MHAYEDMIRKLRQNGVRPGVLDELCIEHGYRATLAEGSNAIDGGANFGMHTLPMSRCVGESGTVFACEPIMEVMIKLVRRLREIGAHNVCPFCFALSDKLDIADFTVYKKAFARSSLRPRKNSPSDIDAETEMRRVLVCPLDEAIPRNKKIDFIKLDLEGGEFPALRGARALLERDRPLIGFESAREKAADKFAYTSEDFFTFFDDVNYDLSTIDGRPFDRSHWTVPKFVVHFWATPRESTAAFREQMAVWIEQAFQSLRESPRFSAESNGGEIVPE